MKKGRAINLIITLGIVCFLAFNVAAAPKVTSATPSNGAKNIPLNTNTIELTLDTDINPLDWMDNIGITTEYGHETNRIIGFEKDGGKYVIFLDGSPLFENTIYTIDLGDFEDSDGNKMDEYSFSFTTESSFKFPWQIIGIIVGIILVIGILVWLIILLKRTKSKTPKKEAIPFEILYSRTEKAILDKNREEAGKHYSQLKIWFEKLPENKKKIHYPRILDLFNQISKI